jgi:8-oxo-dGTP pyrophosphatase MutT (NUDIX family)
VDISSAAEVPVRPASTVITLRPASQGFEVLMVRRVRSAVFMGDARVFPGGALDEADYSPLAARAVRWQGDAAELPWRAAALRELAEEAGVFVTDPPGERAAGGGAGLYEALVERGTVFDADCLAYLSNWVTPRFRGAARRFDTRFYAVVVPAGTGAGADRAEVTEASWVSPAEALRRAEGGDWKVEFPTLCHLQALAGCSTPAEVLAMAPAPGEVVPVRPRVVLTGGDGFRILLPDDPGYSEALP